MAVVPEPTIVLLTNLDDPSLELRNVRRFADGSGFVCDLHVRCHGFSAERPFYFSENSFNAALKALTQMDVSLEGKARLEEDYDCGQFLQLSMMSLGHVLVTGNLILHAKYTNCLSFAFETDQTCLAPFRRSLAALNNA